MNDLVTLIDGVVKKNIKSQQLTNITPCKVVNVIDNDNIEIELISNKARYIVPNYSGSKLDIGDTAQLFYKGIVSSKRAYIGNTLYKESFNTLIMQTSITGLTDNPINVAQIDIQSQFNAIVIITFNCCALGANNGHVQFSTYVDNVECSYKPISSITESNYTSINFSIPVSLEKGFHSISIQAVGLGSIEQVSAYIFGQGITTGTYQEQTFDDDYICITNENYTDIIYYIGGVKNPKIPSIINEKPVRTICATAFNNENQGVESVYIPDGVIEIE